MGDLIKMEGYIYTITNIQTGKQYIGKTFNFEQRKLQHLSALRKNKHHSVELQRAYNKYGENSFLWDVKKVQIKTENDLNAIEMQEIEKANSYLNGYNETMGGDGHKLTFDFSTSVALYYILQHYKGVNRKIAEYYSCDHTVINQIAKNNLFNIEPDLNVVNQIITEVGLTDENLKDNYVAHNSKKLTDEQCLEIISVIFSTSGYDQILCDIFMINSKVTYRLKKHLIYKDIIQQYLSMTLETQEQLKMATFKKYDLENIRSQRQRKGVKNSLTQDQVNYILTNKDLKTRKQIGLDLNISADRVGAVILGKSYPDLVKNYYSSI